ncbi:phosphomannose isomerase-like protein [gut metagenome]|uniref:Phosphomannose isomerase-like protein n=1 Tax=gut metagenome TaxID=749906 RepID=J9H245_9ZZZZ
MRAAPNRPLRLAPNRVSYIIPGGGLIDRFLKLEKSEASQLWVASCVNSALPGAGDSRSRILAEDGGEVLADLLQGDPEGYLGERHAREFGPQPGFLLKLLNSRDRLLVQTHPDGARARKYFNAPCGKAEGWYVLDVDQSRGPALVWAGFKPDVTPERFRALIEKQDCPAILDCLHSFAIAPGDVVFIPPGMPHALGAGSLVAEIQQPIDLTLRAERFRPDGSALAPESLHSGAGMDALLDCFDFSWAADREQVRKRCFKHHAPKALAGGSVQRILGSDETDRFTMDRIRCTGRLTRASAPFRVLLAEKGEGFVEAGGERLAFQKGQEMFLPAGIREYTLLTQTELCVLECAPPQTRYGSN